MIDKRTPVLCNVQWPTSNDNRNLFTSTIKLGKDNQTTTLPLMLFLTGLDNKRCQVITQPHFYYFFFAEIRCFSDEILFDKYLRCL